MQEAAVFIKGYDMAVRDAIFLDVFNDIHTALEIFATMSSGKFKMSIKIALL